MFADSLIDRVQHRKDSRTRKKNIFLILLSFVFVVAVCFLCLEIRKNKAFALERTKLTETLKSEKEKYELLNFRVGGFHSHCFGDDVNLTEKMHELDVAAGQCVSIVALDYSGRVVIVTNEGIAYDSIGCTVEKIVPFLQGIGAC